MTLGTLKCTTLEDDASNTITVANIVAKPNAASPTFTGTVTLPGTTALNGQASDITIIDNNAAALEIKEGTTAYITFDTTNTSEQIEVAKKVQLAEDLEFTTGKDILIADDQATALEIKQGGNAYLTFNTTNNSEKVECNKTFDVTLAEIESQRSTFTALSGATPTADISAASTFTLSVAGNVTVSFSQPPPNNIVTAFMIQVQYSSGTLTWPNTVEWVEDGTAPTMTGSRTTTFLFYTPNGGTKYFGSYLLDYNP